VIFDVLKVSKYEMHYNGAKKTSKPPEAVAEDQLTLQQCALSAGGYKKSPFSCSNPFILSSILKVVLISQILILH
jgi:hypothetical protein